MNSSSPFTDAFFQDPYPVYAEMRDSDSPFWLEMPGDPRIGGAWMFTRYDDVKKILSNAHDTSVDIKQLVPESERNPFHYMLLYSDPPDHTRIRSLVSQPFSKAAVQRLDDMILGVVDPLIEKMRQQGKVDFVDCFAIPFPVNVISRIMGTPFEDADLLRDWTMILTRALDSTVADDEAIQKAGIALQDMTRYFSSILARPRQVPGSVIETLVSSADKGRCSPQETLAQCMLLLLAGHETTVNLLANGLYTLLSNPGELAMLRQNPALAESAVNEILRYEAPFQRATFRVTTSPIRIGSQELKAGERISAVMSAANRDPRQFPEPDRFDIRRKPNRHLSFGLGIHRCLGEKLARSEARIAFSRLLESLPTLELSEPKPRWQSRSLFRALETLPLKLQ
jgi:cytochrome P450